MELVKNEKARNIIGWIFKIIFLSTVYFGTIRTADTAWAIGDIGVGLMAWTNIIAILLLSKTAMKVWKDYKSKRKQGIQDPEFDPKAIGIKNADFWENKSE
mgnify:CR=1 FL=1